MVYVRLLFPKALGGESVCKSTPILSMGFLPSAQDTLDAVNRQWSGSFLEFWLPWTMSPDIFPSHFVGMAELCGSYPYNVPVPLVEAQDVAMAGPSECGDVVWHG